MINLNELFEESVVLLSGFRIIFRGLSKGKFRPLRFVLKTKTFASKGLGLMAVIITYFITNRRNLVLYFLMLV